MRLTCQQVCSSWQWKHRAWPLSSACYSMTVLEMWCKFRKTADLDVFIKSFCRAESHESKHRREGKIPEVWHGGRLCLKANFKEEGDTLESEQIPIYESLIQCPLKIHTPPGVSSGQARALLRILLTRRQHPARGEPGWKTWRWALLTTWGKATSMHLQVFKQSTHCVPDRELTGCSCDWRAL